MVADGNTLFSLVEGYAALGLHRTGGPADTATVEWMADLLSQRGLTVTRDPVRWEQCQVRSELTADGAAIEHLTVPYEFDGTVQADGLVPARFDAAFGGRPEPLDQVIAEHNAHSAEPLLLSTGGANGSLRAVNRRVSSGSGVPTVLVAERDHERLQSGATLRASSTTRPASALNLIATNQLDGPRLLITTPLNGWFSCASERGTGIAAMLEVIDALADQPLMVAATTGHELGCFGAVDLASQLSEPLVGIVHVGASIAAEERTADGSRALASTRVMMTSLPETESPQALQAATDGRWIPHTDATNWLGEATTWSTLNVPLLSFSGAGPHFHTPEDLPEIATSPESLARTATALARATDEFAAAARRSARHA